MRMLFAFVFRRAHVSFANGIIALTGCYLSLLSALKPRIARDNGCAPIWSALSYYFELHHGRRRQAEAEG